MLLASPAFAGTPASTDSLLERLVGSWSMVGQVRGKPVEYRMEARRTLRDRFVEMHMEDVARPPSYEARVFLGVDEQGSGLIVHWLDSYGAGYSVPHAIGSADGDTLRFQFACADGPFRDRFSYDRRHDQWHFRLETGDSSGAWRLFGDYIVKRR